MLLAHLDPAKFPYSYVVDTIPENLVWQFGAEQMMYLIRENMWDFVPSLYKEIMGIEYQP